ncbi:MAG TPA: MarR family transcriptional regulator [Ignavibacteriaceae bacterium]|nr:MarR family transcriptional regulator [Ignavibacteriaceae bacterium]
MGDALKQRLKQKTFESPDQESFLNIFVTANFLRMKNDEVLSRYGLTSPQYNVLRILKGKFPDGYPRCDIITRMMDQAPDVTRLIDRLIKEGYVERFNSSEDRRLSIAKITDKGLQLLDKLKPEIESLHKLISDNLNKEERKQLSALLEKIYANYVVN